jgi:hypothetical protein
MRIFIWTRAAIERNMRIFCWLCGGIVRYRLSSQQKVHRCNSVLEKGKSMRGDNSFYFLQLSIIYGIILRLIYSISYQITHAPWCHIRKGESIPTAPLTRAFLHLSILATAVPPIQFFFHSRIVDIGVIFVRMSDGFFFPGIW